MEILWENNTEVLNTKASHTKTYSNQRSLDFQYDLNKTANYPMNIRICLMSGESGGSMVSLGEM